MCHCYNNLTRCGGTMSRDFNSYGPEEYMLRNAGPGTYKIDCKVVQTNRGTSTYVQLPPSRAIVATY